MTDSLTLIIKVIVFERKPKWKFFNWKKLVTFFGNLHQKAKYLYLQFTTTFLNRNDVFERKVPIHSMKKQNVLAKNTKNYFRAFLLV